MKWFAHPTVLTAGMAARGFWLSLLPQLYEGRGSIARSSSELARYLGMSELETLRSLRELEPLLQPTADCLVCPDLQKEFDIRQRRRTAGKMGGNPSLKGKAREPVAGPKVVSGRPLTAHFLSPAAPVPPAPPVETTPPVVAAPLALEAEPELFAAATVPALSAGDMAFERFWESYPCKVGKGAARHAFHKRRLHLQIETLLEAIEEQRGSRKFREGYIPNPATWLNQERWLDEVDQPFARIRAELGEFPKRFPLWLRKQPAWSARRWDTYRAVDAHIREAFEQWNKANPLA